MRLRLAEVFLHKSLDSGGGIVDCVRVDFCYWVIEEIIWPRLGMGFVGTENLLIENLNMEVNRASSAYTT